MIDIVAHAGGFGWDEALVFALPVVVLVVLQVLGRPKANQATDTAPPSSLEHEDDAPKGEDR